MLGVVDFRDDSVLFHRHSHWIAEDLNHLVNVPSPRPIASQIISSGPDCVPFYPFILNKCDVFGPDCVAGTRARLSPSLTFSSLSFLSPKEFVSPGLGQAPFPDLKVL